MFQDECVCWCWCRSRSTTEEQLFDEDELTTVLCGGVLIAKLDGSFGFEAWLLPMQGGKANLNESLANIGEDFVGTHCCRYCFSVLI